MDPKTQELIETLERKKKFAVEKEDYVEAGRLAEQIKVIRGNQERLSELEYKKGKAIKEEDYEKAQIYKIEIEKLKSQ